MHDQGISLSKLSEYRVMTSCLVHLVVAYHFKSTSVFSGFESGDSGASDQTVERIYYSIHG